MVLSYVGFKVATNSADPSTEVRLSHTMNLDSFFTVYDLRFAVWHFASWTSIRVTCDCLLPFVHPLLSQVNVLELCVRCWGATAWPHVGGLTHQGHCYNGVTQPHGIPLEALRRQAATASGLGCQEFPNIYVRRWVGTYVRTYVM